MEVVMLETFRHRTIHPDQVCFKILNLQSSHFALRMAELLRILLGLALGLSLPFGLVLIRWFSFWSSFGR